MFQYYSGYTKLKDTKRKTKQSSDGRRGYATARRSLVQSTSTPTECQVPKHLNPLSYRYVNPAGRSQPPTGVLQQEAQAMPAGFQKDGHQPPNQTSALPTNTVDPKRSCSCHVCACLIKESIVLRRERGRPTPERSLFARPVLRRRVPSTGWTALVSSAPCRAYSRQHQHLSRVTLGDVVAGPPDEKNTTTHVPVTLAR